MYAKESALIPIVKNQWLNTKEPQQIYKNNMQNPLYYYQTLKVGQHHTMDPIMEGILTTTDIQEQYAKSSLLLSTLEVGQHHKMDPIMEEILSCSLASSRGHPPIELLLQIH